MLLVEPPEDWSPEASAAVSGEFDDIEKVLAGEASSETVPVEPKKAAPKLRPVPNPNPNPNPASTTDTPLLPGEQWTSTATQQKRKWLLLTAGIVTILALAAAVVLAFLANRGAAPNEQPIASQDGNVQQPVAEPVTEDLPEPDPAANDPEPSAEDSEASNQPDSGMEPETQVPEQPQFETEASETEPAEPVAVPPPPPSKPEPMPQAADIDDVDLKLDQPFGAACDELLNEGDVAPRSVETNFGALSDTLEGAGASLFEFSQIASVNERTRLGTKKYFVFQPESLNPKNVEGLNLPLEGLQYNKQTLPMILSDFFEITGVPVTLDADVLESAGFDFGYRTGELKVTKTTFAAALNRILSDVAGAADSKFSLRYDGTGPAQITVANADDRDAVELPSPRIENVDDKMRELMVQLIKNFTGGDDVWDAGGQGASLAFSADEAADKIAVVNNPETVALVKQFAEGWNDAVAVTNGDAEPSALDSTWLQSQNSRERQFRLNSQHDTPVLQFAAAFQNDTQINLLFDWDSLMQVGWNPRTKIPPGLSEDKVGELLDELTHSMGLAYRAINENTFEITTVEKVDTKPRIEFHSCHSILGGKLSEKQMVDVVKNSLQTATQNLGRWRVVFEPSIKSFIVSGPETLHRQIDAILKRIQEL